MVALPAIHVLLDACSGSGNDIPHRTPTIRICLGTDVFRTNILSILLSHITVNSVTAYQMKRGCEADQTSAVEPSQTGRNYPSRLSATAHARQTCSRSESLRVFNAVTTMGKYPLPVNAAVRFCNHGLILHRRLSYRDSRSNAHLSNQDLCKHSMQAWERYKRAAVLMDLSSISNHQIHSFLFFSV